MSVNLIVTSVTLLLQCIHDVLNCLIVLYFIIVQTNWILRCSFVIFHRKKTVLFEVLNIHKHTRVAQGSDREIFFFEEIKKAAIWHGL